MLAAHFTANLNPVNTPHPFNPQTVQWYIQHNAIIHHADTGGWWNGSKIEEPETNYWPVISNNNNKFINCSWRETAKLFRSPRREINVLGMTQLYFWESFHWETAIKPFLFSLLNQRFVSWDFPRHTETDRRTQIRKTKVATKSHESLCRISLSPYSFCAFFFSLENSGGYVWLFLSLDPNES